MDPMLGAKFNRVLPRNVWETVIITPVEQADEQMIVDDKYLGDGVKIGPRAFAGYFLKALFEKNANVFAPEMRGRIGRALAASGKPVINSVILDEHHIIFPGDADKAVRLLSEIFADADTNAALRQGRESPVKLSEACATEPWVKAQGILPRHIYLTVRGGFTRFMRQHNLVSPSHD